MAHTFIRFHVDGRSEWLAADGQAHAGLPAPEADRRLTVLVPAEDVLLMDAPRVARSPRQLDQALPFAIEDQLASPVESQHVAWSASDKADRVRVGVVARERVDEWLGRLRAAGLEPDALVPDALALPRSENRACLLAEPGRTTLRVDDARGLAATPEEVLALSAWLPEAVDVWQVGECESPLPAHDRRRVAHAMAAFAAGPTTPALNLLQGAYAPRRRAGGAQRGWRWAALLAIAAVVLVFVSALVDRQKLAARVAAQEQEMADLYRRAVPGATQVDDAAQQLQSVLAARGFGGGDAAVQLLARAAPALAADARVSLESVEYREGRMDLVVQAADVAGLDGLRQRLARAGLPVEITASTPGTLGVQGRLRIGGQP